MKTSNRHIIIKIIFVFCSLFLVLSIQSQELESLIKKSLENNPKIKQFELQYKIASEKVNEVNTIPNTEIGIGYFVSQPETRTGAQRTKVSLKQMIPWFGSITARENYVSSLADAKYEDIVIAKRKLMMSVSKYYYNLYAIKTKQEVIVENIELLKTYKTLMLSSIEVGKASVVDVLRLQMRQNELEQLKQVLEQEYLGEQTALNKLLNRDKNTVIYVVNGLIIPLENSLINSENIELHPELTKYDKLYKSVEKSEILNQKENKPMIGFGLDYISVSERPNVNFNDNGKDILMPMLSLSIPIFNKKYKSRTRQNNLKKQEIKAQKQDRLNRLESILNKAIASIIAARISYNTQIKNLKQAKNTEKILIKNYETGTINFNDVLDVQELRLKFQINQIKSVKKYFIQMTIINYFRN